jgi:hypothetical protein
MLKWKSPCPTRFLFLPTSTNPADIWDIHQNGKSCDMSYHSFATKREAQADAQRFVYKLIIIWQKNN